MCTGIYWYLLTWRQNGAIRFSGVPTLSSSLNVQLTDALRKYVDERASDKDVYATPSEYIRDVIRRDMQDRAIALNVLEGLDDLKHGRFSSKSIRDFKDKGWHPVRRARYVLTARAAADLREARAWSRARCGKELTSRYFDDLHEGARFIAENQSALRLGQELSGGTGLLVYPVREHYIVYEPLAGRFIAVVAVIPRNRIGELRALSPRIPPRSLQLRWPTSDALQ
jgi:antitoxin ParD1/3/4